MLRMYARFGSEKAPFPINQQFLLGRKVPRDGILRVKVYDKDESYMKDDYIGDFAVMLGEGGQSEQDITGRLGKKHGSFKINVSDPPGIVISLKWS